MRGCLASGPAGHHPLPSLFLALSTAPLCPHLPFSCSPSALFLWEIKGFPRRKAQSIEASGKPPRRPCTDRLFLRGWRCLSPRPACSQAPPSAHGQGPGWTLLSQVGQTRAWLQEGPPALGVSTVSPGQAEGGQLPGSLFQKGWHAGRAASVCDSLPSRPAAATPLL